MARFPPEAIRPACHISANDWIVAATELEVDVPRCQISKPPLVSRFSRAVSVPNWRLSSCGVAMSGIRFRRKEGARCVRHVESTCGGHDDPPGQYADTTGTRSRLAAIAHSPGPNFGDRWRDSFSGFVRDHAPNCAAGCTTVTVKGELTTGFANDLVVAQTSTQIIRRMERHVIGRRRADHQHGVVYVERSR